MNPIIPNSALPLIQSTETPFYFYNTELLNATLEAAQKAAAPFNYKLHYAIKANHNAEILQEIINQGFQADCVSGNEVAHSVQQGFAPEHVFFAGVGKTDKEINTALDLNIACFNCESYQEIEVINQLAAAKNKTANISIRINPEINANTHKYITTGLKENKFGIELSLLPELLDQIDTLKHIDLIGIHFHIGSQITDISAFAELAQKAHKINNDLLLNGWDIKIIDLGGGLGVDYENPAQNPIPDFDAFFTVIQENLKPLVSQEVHFELGRSLVAQCGVLFTHVLYNKPTSNHNFLIVDAGMTELLRPALYQSYHYIESLSVSTQKEIYDVVGPICESSDTFGKNRTLNSSKRGDLIAIYSAGAYGSVMASEYNMRPKVQEICFNQKAEQKLGLAV